MADQNFWRSRLNAKNFDTTGVIYSGDEQQMLLVADLLEDTHPRASKCMRYGIEWMAGRGIRNKHKGLEVTLGKSGVPHFKFWYSQVGEFGDTGPRRRNIEQLPQALADYEHPPINRDQKPPLKRYYLEEHLAAARRKGKQ